MFHIEDHRANEAQFAKQFFDLASAVSGPSPPTSSQLLNSLDVIVKSLPPLDAAQVYVDLAIVSSRNREDALMFLGFAESVISQSSSATDSLNDPSSLHSVILRLREVVSAMPEAPSEYLPTMQHALDAGLGSRVRLREGRRSEAIAVLTKALLTHLASSSSAVRAQAVAHEHACMVALVEALGPDPAAGYLGVLFAQLRTLESPYGEDLADPTSAGALALIPRHPAALLARLVCDARALAPLISVAQTLHMDLVQVVVRACCPLLFLPHLTSGTTSSPYPQLITAPYAGSTVRVLNTHEQSRAPSAEASDPSAAVITHDILQHLNKALRELCAEACAIEFTPGFRSLALASPAVTDALASTASLAYLVLSGLADADRRCTYANICNIMRIHASLVLGPPASLALRTSWEAAVAYHIGELGLVSLLDLEHSFLRASLPPPRVLGFILSPFLSTLPEDSHFTQFVVRHCDETIAFAMWDGLKGSPSPTPLVPSLMKNAIASARSSFLSEYSVIDTSTMTITLPALLEAHKSSLFASNCTDADIIAYVLKAIPAGSVMYLRLSNSSFRVRFEASVASRAFGLVYLPDTHSELQVRASRSATMSSISMSPRPNRFCTTSLITSSFLSLFA